MRVASFVEEVQSTQDRRSALYQSYDDAINRFKTSKDANAFGASRKKVDADYRQLTTQIQTLQQQLKAEGTDIAEKVVFECVHKLKYAWVGDCMLWSADIRFFCQEMEFFW